MKDKIVSIITPCYNVAETLERYLRSILSQTYKHLEVIAVDDGSTDCTSKILKEYQAVFRENQMELKYIFQKNAGLGAAINTGLKYVTGSYLCWADPDDFFMPESIEKRLKILLNNPEYAVVSSDAYVFYSNDLKHPVKREASRFDHREEENQFELLLREESHFCAGCHMVRMSAFDQVNPEREIYQARRGQNWQLLLPLYYHYKRKYLDEPLYAYIVYPQSMSAGDTTEEKELIRWAEHEKIIVETLKRISMRPGEEEKYLNQTTKRYAMKRFYTAIDYRDRELLIRQYRLLERDDAVTKEVKRLYLRNRYFIWKIFFKLRDSVKEKLCAKYP